MPTAVGLDKVHSARDAAPIVHMHKIDGDIDKVEKTSCRAIFLC